jgi:hypothetical protein
VNLAWTDTATTETAFEVYRQVGGGAWTRVVALPPNTTSYADLGLSAGSSYLYQVRATSNEGASGFSNPVSVTLPGS